MPIVKYSLYSSPPALGSGEYNSPTALLQLLQLLRPCAILVTALLVVHCCIGSSLELADASNVSLRLKSDKRRIVDFGTFAFGGMYGGRLELGIQDLYLHNEEDMFSGLVGGKIGFAIDHVLSPSSARRSRTAALKATKTAVPSSSSPTPPQTPKGKMDVASSITAPPQLIAGRIFNTLRVIEESPAAAAKGEETTTTTTTTTSSEEGKKEDTTTVPSETNLDEELTTMGDDVVLPSNKCFVDEASMVPESRYLLKLEETILNAVLTVLKAAREDASKQLNTPRRGGGIEKKLTKGSVSSLSTKRPLQSTKESLQIHRQRRLSQELAALIPDAKERRKRLSLALANSKIVFDISGRKPGYYAIFFYNCKGGNSAMVPSPITFRVKTSQYNIMDEGVGGGGKVSYLPFGDTHLPAIYLFFFLVFVGCGVVWYQVVHGAASLDTQELQRVSGSRKVAGSSSASKHLGGTVVSRVKLIHKLMGALLFLKCVTLLLNAAMLHHRKVTGQMNAAIDYFFYALQFFKGVFLFTIILLLGSGWSLLRPLLTDRDRKILLLLIPLQLVVNIALIVLDETSEGNKYWSWWKDILRAVDICCCVCVMLPVAFSMRSLQQQSAVLEERQRAPVSPTNATTTTVSVVTSDREEENDEKQDSGRLHLLGTPQHQPNHLLLELSEEDNKMAEKASKKLKFFSGFYIATAAFMYLTRVLVDYLAGGASYQYTWVAPTLGETVTLAYYCYCGYAFRPVAKQSWEEDHHNGALLQSRRKGAFGTGGNDGVVNQKSSATHMTVVQEVTTLPPPTQIYVPHTSTHVADNNVGSAASPLPQRPPTSSSSDYRGIHRKGNNKVTEMMLGEELEEIPLTTTTTK